MRDFCSPDCKVAFRHSSNLAKQRRYLEKQDKLREISNSNYARILATYSVRVKSSRRFIWWVHEQISETLTEKEIEEIIKKLAQ